jgi:hypothetical protein
MSETEAERLRRESKEASEKEAERLTERAQKEAAEGKDTKQ